MLSVDIEEEHNSELLQHIVQLWLTIRGFSISKAWMENYKCAAKSNISVETFKEEFKEKSEHATTNFMFSVTAMILSY